jgi:hypothetical protein
MPLTTASDNQQLDKLFGGTNYAPPANLYIGLSTTAPTKAGGNVTEPVGNAYARVAVTNNAANWPNAAAGSKANANAVNFAEPTGAGWGTVTHFVVYDALAAGNLVAYGTLAANKTIGAGSTVSFAAGAIVITET